MSLQGRFLPRSNLPAARKRLWQGIASVAALLRNDILQTVGSPGKSLSDIL
jgi:hypothetical protein